MSALVEILSGLGDKGPAAIVVEELVQLGAKRLIRVGTCGGLQPDMKLGDLIIALTAVPAVVAPADLHAAKRPCRRIERGEPAVVLEADQPSFGARVARLGDGGRHAHDHRRRRRGSGVRGPVSRHGRLGLSARQQRLRQ